MIEATSTEIEKNNETNYIVKVVDFNLFGNEISDKVDIIIDNKNNKMIINLNALTKKRHIKKYLFI